MQGVEQIQHMSAPGDGVVLLPLELRCITELERGAQLPAQVPSGGPEALQGLRRFGLLQKTDENFGIAQVRGGFYTGCLLYTSDAADEL